MSPNPFTNENNINESRPNERLSADERSSFALGKGYSNGTSIHFSQSWKPNTGIGTFQQMKHTNGGANSDVALSAMPSAGSNPASFQERSSHQLPHLKVKMDAVYPSNDDSHVNKIVNSTNHHINALNPQMRHSNWEIQNKNQYNPSGHSSYGFRAEVHNQDSLHNGYNHHLPKQTPSNEFLRQNNMSHRGNQMLMNKGQGSAENFNHKDFQTVMSSTHNSEQHRNFGQPVPRHSHISRHQVSINLFPICTFLCIVLKRIV